jgi:hypothetical protein
MPTVTRSDCTQIDVVESFVIDYSSTSGNFTSKLTSVDVNFNACQGINNQNNNLWAYMARLYYQGDITPNNSEWLAASSPTGAARGRPWISSTR